MKTLSNGLTIIAAVILVVAIISRLLLTPIPIAAGLEAQALGQLASILLLLVIALNTQK
ncbi:MAG: hypothetical protein QME68_05865 [Elusimicrobiota bacterium]|nr:hypothetical protein [Elusimicrobiota bacterium]